MTSTTDEALQQGIQLLKSGNAEEAANIFEQETKERVSKHGELGLPCAEVYYWYGKSLLEVARTETDQLLFAIKETPKGISGSFSQSASAILKTTAKPITQSEPDKPTASTSEGLTGMKIEEEEGSEEQGAEQGENEAETFQIAWEWLDTARVILERTLDSVTDEAERAKVTFLYSDVLLCLGQLGLETDNVESSQQDLELCLKYQQQVLPSTDRAIAETHFYLGIAYQLNKNLNEALAAFDEAKQIITTILSDSSISSGIQMQLKNILKELETKTAETHQLLTGVDSAKPDDVKKEIAELFDSTPKPMPQKDAVVVRDMGVFGNTGKKRSRTDSSSVATESETEETEPPAKQQKTE